MIKDVLVNLDVDSDDTQAATFAISVASAFEAHLSAIAFAYNEFLPRILFGRATAQIVEQKLREWEAAAVDAASKFEETARGAGLLAEAQILKSGIVQAAEHFGSFARRFDIAVVTQTELGGLRTRQLIVEAALFDSGRPVIVVPYVHQNGLKLDKVLVCWDGSRSAGRAVGDSMPFLSRATAVEIVVVSGELRKNEIAGAEIAHHLGRHGLKADLNQIFLRDLDIADTILSHAADVGADLIVMGGYGHSRMREKFLGGATQGILEAMTVPTLMSH